MCNPREEGDSSDDAYVSVFVHKDDDIANRQRVHIELIKVSNDYFSLRCSYWSSEWTSQCS